MSIPNSPFHQGPLEERYDSQMTLALTEGPMTALREYAHVPIIFTVDRVLDVTNRDDGPGGFALSKRRLEVPYEKDYDDGLTMLDGRRDLAVLWDTRVSPDARRQGVGSALFERVEAWARWA